MFSSQEVYNQLLSGSFTIRKQTLLRTPPIRFKLATSNHNNLKFVVFFFFFCTLFPVGSVKMNCFRLNYFYNTNWTTAYTSSLLLDNKYLVATWWLYCLFPSLRNTLARPKSAIFRCPVELISKLAGFKSLRKERIAIKYIFLSYKFYHEMAFMP